MAIQGPEVLRIRNYGGNRRASASGGSGVEFYAVYQVPVDDFNQAHNLGLPSVGDFSLNPDLKWMGTVQDVDQVQEFSKADWVARVRYSQGGTFNFSTRLGSRSTAQSGPVNIPVIGFPVSAGPTGGVYYSIPKERWRTVWHRSETARYSGSVDTAQDILTRNFGRFYMKRSGQWISQNLRGQPQLQPLLYQLVGADIATDAGNNTRIQTFFQTRAGFPAFAANRFAANTLAIDELPANCDYSDDYSAGRVVIVNPFDDLPDGEPLPWLP